MELDLGRGCCWGRTRGRPGCAVEAALWGEGTARACRCPRPPPSSASARRGPGARGTLLSSHSAASPPLGAPGTLEGRPRAGGGRRRAGGSRGASLGKRASPGAGRGRGSPAARRPAEAPGWRPRCLRRTRGLPGAAGAVAQGWSRGVPGSGRQGRGREKGDLAQQLRVKQQQKALLAQQQQGLGMGVGQLGDPDTVGHCACGGQGLLPGLPGSDCCCCGCCGCSAAAAAAVEDEESRPLARLRQSKKGQAQKAGAAGTEAASRQGSGGTDGACGHRHRRQRGDADAAFGVPPGGQVRTSLRPYPVGRIDCTLWCSYSCMCAL